VALIQSALRLWKTSDYLRQVNEVNGGDSVRSVSVCVCVSICVCAADRSVRPVGR